MALIEVFAGYDRAVVVDAILTGRNPPGTIIELGLADVGRGPRRACTTPAYPSWPP